MSAAAAQKKLLKKGTLGVVGLGVMGKALIQGLLDSAMVTKEQIWGIDKAESHCKQTGEQFQITVGMNYEGRLANAEMILLCVKPKHVESALKELKKSGLTDSTLIISIAAGKKLEQIEGALQTNNPVIRAMPNTPAVVQQGLTVLAGGTHANPEHLAQAQLIFSAVGQCFELSESHFDAVTAMGGSGPAYYYLMMEALADGGVRVGLPRDVALKMATQVALGAATMVQKTGRHPAALKDDVTTPAGCTIAALLVMEDGKIRSILARAVEEAAKVASELG